jgi:hypothetical protein
MKSQFFKLNKEYFTNLRSLIAPYSSKVDAVVIVVYKQPRKTTSVSSHHGYMYDINVNLQGNHNYRFVMPLLAMASPEKKCIHVMLPPH